MIIFTSILFVVIAIVFWLFYCIFTLPSEDEYGRKEQSNAFMKRQAKGKKK